MNPLHSLRSPSHLIRTLAFLADTALLLQPLDAHAGNGKNSSTALWPLCLVALGALALRGWSLYQQQARNRLPEPEDDPFSDERITTTFVAAIPTLTRELNLEVATSEQVEFFERSDQKTLLWGLLDLGTNIATIRVPATYRYHIRLHDAWHLETRDGTVIVQAPPLRSSQPPAIHTHRMEKNTQRGWCRLGPDKMLEALEREITPTLSRYSEDPRHLGLVRDTGRESVALFVRRWLESAGRWKRGGFTAIQVRFHGELAPPPAPTLRLLDF